jgi:hypothetical protein
MIYPGKNQSLRPAMKKAVLAAGLLSFSGALTAEAIVRRHDVADQLYLDFGAQFPSVGRLTSATGLGSGVLISSRWVLSAAHLSTPTQFAVGDGLYTVEEFIRHPDWDGSVTNGNDLALARLSGSVTDVAPSVWYTGSNEIGQIGVSVGFGNTGTGLTGQQSGTAGIRRAAENSIESLGSGSPFTPPRPPDDTLEYLFNEPGDTNVLPLEGMAAQGDSGGPVFIDFGDGYRIAGIHSFVWNMDGGSLATYGDVVVSARVAAYDDWILATVPEPRTWALLAGLAALAVCAVRRRT